MSREDKAAYWSALRDSLLNVLPPLPTMLQIRGADRASVYGYRSLSVSVLKVGYSGDGIATSQQVALILQAARSVPSVRLPTDCGHRTLRSKTPAWPGMSQGLYNLNLSNSKSGQ